MNRLADKVAIITGGSSGIGAETAQLFAEEGAKVVIAARHKDQLDRVAKDIEDAGGEVLAVRCDIANPDDVKRLVGQTLHEFGQIDILVNSAGILERGLRPVYEALDEDIDDIIDNNLKGTLFMCREVLKEMMDTERGAIVNIASLSGATGAGASVFGSANAGIIGLTKHIAFRFTGTPIRANVICPGNTATPMVVGRDLQELNLEMIQAMRNHLDFSAPVANPTDIANIALFLASDESSALTGQVLVADFGTSL